jgi:hypothetical protein
MCQLAPGTWQQALAEVLAAGPGWQNGHPGHPVVEIAINPDVVWLAARSLRARRQLPHRGVSRRCLQAPPVTGASWKVLA